MTREEQLTAACDTLDAETQKVIKPIISDIIFLEARLEELRKLPFISANPRNPTQQRATPASKQYKELMQTYTGLLKLLLGYADSEDNKETSPLREYLNSLKER